MTDERSRPQINWLQAAAGALAAMSSAVLLSTVGVAGTLIGAALGSLVVTVGNAVYSHYLQLSRERVSAVHAATRLRVERARADVQQAAASPEAVGADARLEHAEHELASAEQDLREGRQRVPLREALAGLPWRHLAWIAAAIFVVAMLAILAFELVTGRAVSSYTGGSSDQPRTSIPGLGGDQGPDRPRRPDSTPVPTPSGAPTSTAPTEAPSETPIEPPTQTSEPPAEEPSTPAPSESPAPAPESPSPEPSP